MHALMTTPPIDDVEPFDPEKDRDLFEELAQVLKKHGSQDRFGICLLHHHFDLKDDEILLEETDELNRMQMVRVAKKGFGDTIETQWALKEMPEVRMDCVRSCHKDSKGNHRPVHIRTYGPKKDRNY